MSEFLPYGLLLLAVLTLPWRRICLTLMGIATLSAAFAGVVSVFGVLILALAGLALYLPTRGPRLARRIGYPLFLVLALGLTAHLLPGFKNLQIWHEIRFAADSLPFTMYLNFDKTFVGLWIALLFANLSSAKDLRGSALILLVLILLLLPLALFSGYVRFDPKWPPLIWVVNNLFFVCLAEEALFRGFIQGGLARTQNGFLALLIGAVAFGVAHWQGGIAYVVFATVSGLFYGYAYKRTQNLASSILVHFGLNLIHFSLFSYPALAVMK